MPTIPEGSLFIDLSPKELSDAAYQLLGGRWRHPHLGLRAEVTGFILAACEQGGKASDRQIDALIEHLRRTFPEFPDAQLLFGYGDPNKTSARFLPARSSPPA